MYIAINSGLNIRHIVYRVATYLLEEDKKMNNNEYIKFTEKKLDQLNGSSCKPFTINKHLNGLYDLVYGLDVIAWMLQPCELWQVVNTIAILDILGGVRHDNMEA